MLEIKKRAIYKAFGLTVLSDIVLPELPQLSRKEDKEDVVVEIADLSALCRELNVQQGKFTVIKDLVMFQVPDSAIFCITQGKRISVSPVKGAEEGKVRLYLLGTCMGVLLMQRRVLPLHGSAVEIDGKAYAFVGESGAGKSTLASAFLRSGYSLLSDDVIAVSLSETANIPMVTPSYPQQKLWKESMEEFGLDNSDYSPLFERETKYAVPVLANYQPDPLPLAGIFELSLNNNVDIEVYQINRLERLHTVFRQTFRNFIITRSGLLEWHFHLSSKIVNHVDMFQLCRPKNRFTASQLVALILDIVKEEK